ncbi:T9SS type A sorting domain-containing protein [bacterium]|nr:T9SS type A sorting domain-containing protein [bacterium]
MNRFTSLCATLVLVFIAQTIQAQISLSSSDFPQKGDKFYTNSILLPKNKVPYQIFNTSTTQFNYDLSSLKPDTKGSDYMADPKTLSGGSSVKGADYGFAYSYGTAFFANSGDSINMVALTPNMGLPVPITFQFDSVVNFMTAPLSFPAKMLDSTTSHVQVFPLYDIRAKMKSEYVVNGYGTIKIPGDTTFDVIRLRRVLTFYALAKQNITQQVDTIIDSLVTWEFYTPGYANTVLRVGAKIVNNGTGIDTLAEFTFYDNSTVACPQEAVKCLSKVTLHQNLLIATSPQPVSLKVYSLTGKMELASSASSTNHQINMASLPAGYYFVVSSNGSQLSTTKVYKAQ